MRKLFFIASVASSLILPSCGGDQAKVDKMANEMCAAMAKYKEEDPMTMLDAANAMQEISKKEEEYKDITEDQLKDAMQKNCPDGYKKFMKMVEDSEAK